MDDCVCTNCRGGIDRMGLHNKAAGQGTHQHRVTLVPAAGGTLSLLGHPHKPRVVMLPPRGWLLTHVTLTAVS